jgi:hypothetical protein
MSIERNGPALFDFPLSLPSGSPRKKNAISPHIFHLRKERPRHDSAIGPGQAELPLLTQADVISDVKKDMARLQERLRGWHTYDGAAIIDLLADTVYSLECRRMSLQRMEKRHSFVATCAPVIGTPPIVLRKRLRSNSGLLRRSWNHLRSLSRQRSTFRFGPSA